MPPQHGRRAHAACLGGGGSHRFDLEIDVDGRALGEFKQDLSEDCFAVYSKIIDKPERSKDEHRVHSFRSYSGVSG